MGRFRVALVVVLVTLVWAATAAWASHRFVFGEEPIRCATFSCANRQFSKIRDALRQIAEELNECYGTTVLDSDHGPVTVVTYEC